MKAIYLSRQTPIKKENNRITGLAAVYYNGDPGTEYRLADDLVMRFKKGSLKLMPTVFAYVSHDSGKVLAKTPDTLKLHLDEQGLHFEAALPDTSYSRDLQALIEGGVVQGCSFGCYPGEQHFEEDNDGEILWVDSAEVFEVSPTHNPAFSGTEVALLERDRFRMNSLDVAQRKLDEILKTL